MVINTVAFSQVKVIAGSPLVLVFWVKHPDNMPFLTSYDSILMFSVSEMGFSLRFGPRFRNAVTALVLFPYQYYIYRYHCSNISLPLQHQCNIIAVPLPYLYAVIRISMRYPSTMLAVPSFCTSAMDFPLYF